MLRYTPIIGNFGMTAAESNAWKTLAWVDDASTCIDPVHTLRARRFGTASGCSINGVTVEPTPAVNPDLADVLTISGFGLRLTADINALTALGGNGSALLALNACRFTTTSGSVTAKSGVDLTADPVSETFTVEVSDPDLFAPPVFWRLKVQLE